MSSAPTAPCPFCGSTSIAVRLYAISRVLAGAQTRRGKPAIVGWSVECLQCQAGIQVVGTGAEDKARALERWNQRRSPEERAAVKAPPKNDTPERLARAEGRRKRFSIFRRQDA